MARASASPIEGDAARKLSNSGVSVGPGQTTFNVTPLRASSRASVLVNAMMPPLHAAYTASPDEPTRPASDATLTTRPKPRSAMPRATTWCMFSGPYRLIWMTLSHSARSVSRKSTRRVPSRDVRQPLHRTARRLERRDGRGDLIAVGDVDAIGLRLPAAHCAAVSCAPASLRSKIPSTQPSSARRSAAARPMPLAPPVRITRLPSSPRIRSG